MDRRNRLRFDLARRKHPQAAFDAVVAELGLLRASGILLGSVSAP